MTDSAASIPTAMDGLTLMLDGLRPPSAMGPMPSQLTRLNGVMKTETALEVTKLETMLTSAPIKQAPPPKIESAVLIGTVMGIPMPATRSQTIPLNGQIVTAITEETIQTAPTQIYSLTTHLNGWIPMVMVTVTTVVELTAMHSRTIRINGLTSMVTASVIISSMKTAMESQKVCPMFAKTYLDTQPIL
jgi:hypothetical protein